MRISLRIAIALSAMLLIPEATRAQGDAGGARDALMGHFNYSAGRITALAEAMPADSYGWRPGEGVMSVEEVYTHIARYNYYYLESSLGVAAPDDVDVASMEEITGKDAVVEVLQRSVQHVRDAMSELPPERLNAEVTLYGRSVPGWQVLLQLVTHMNEHVGQSIAYARTNGVVPPWSRGQ